MSCCILPQLLYLCIVLIWAWSLEAAAADACHLSLSNICDHPNLTPCPSACNICCQYNILVSDFHRSVSIVNCIECCRDLMGLHHIIHSSGELLSELCLTNWHSLECANIECKKRNSMRVAKVNRLRSRPHLLIRPSIRSDRVNIRNLFIHIVLFPMTILSTIVFTPPPFSVYFYHATAARHKLIYYLLWHIKSYTRI